MLILPLLLQVIVGSDLRSKIKINYVILDFYERASASAQLVNGSLWQNPRDEGGGTVFNFCEVYVNGDI